MCSYRNSSVGLSDGECVAGVSEINEVCNGLSKRGTRYLWRGTPPVYGETHLVHAHTRTHTHTSQSARPKNCRWGSNAPQTAEQQVDRHFLWCLPSPCVLLRAGNMRWQNFLPDEQTEGTVALFDWYVHVWVEFDSAFPFTKSILHLCNVWTLHISDGVQFVKSLNICSTGHFQKGLTPENSVWVELRLIMMFTDYFHDLISCVV